jgi:hypothetical protein
MARVLQQHLVSKAGDRWDGTFKGVTIADTSGCELHTDNSHKVSLLMYQFFLSDESFITLQILAGPDYVVLVRQLNHTTALFPLISVEHGLHIFEHALAGTDTHVRAHARPRACIWQVRGCRVVVATIR